MGTTTQAMIAAGTTDYSGTYSGTYSGYDSGTWTVTISTSGAVLGIAYSGISGAFAIDGQVSSDGSMIMTAGSVSGGTVFSGTVDSVTGAVFGAWTNNAYGLGGSFAGNGSLGNVTGNGGTIPINITSGTFTLMDVVPGVDIINISSGAAAMHSLTVATASYATNTTNSGTLVIHALPTTASMITGSPGNDIITGSSADDSLDGSAGSDVLKGGVGNDVMTGGSGNDTYHVDSTGDSVVETASGSAALSPRLALDLGGGIDKVIASISYTLGNALENLDLASGSGNLAGTGNALDNELNGNEGHNTLTGAAGNDALDGGVGIDTASYTGNRAGFTLAQSGTGFIVTNSTGTEGTDTLTNVERLVFADARIALDVIGGNAGTAAKILGATVGAASATNPTYMGIILGYLDSGTSYADLMGAVLNALGATTPTAAVTTLLTNILDGAAPPADLVATCVSMINGGTYSVGAFGVLAADYNADNTAHINLVGLAQTGIGYV